MGWIVSVIIVIVALVVMWRQRSQHEAALKKQRQANAKAIEGVKEEQAQQLDRLQRETDRVKSQGHLKLVEDLLPGLDALIEAQKIAQTQSDYPPQLAKGLGMVTTQFEQALGKHGVERVEPQKGDAFDPTVHEAVAMTEDPSYESNSVASSMRTGWRHETRVLRPAMVQVNKHQQEMKKDDAEEDVTFDFEEQTEQVDEQAAVQTSVQSS